MSETKLQDLLKELHRELDKNQTIVPEERARLKQLADDISNQERHSTIEQLEETATRFEVVHPELTEILARVINQLSNMGI